MIKDTDKFRQAALHFQKYGYYTASPKGTTGYKEYWDEETKRCLFGWTSSDGDFISGYNYFYLNFSPILIVSEREIKLGENQTKKIVERKRDFPKFYDYDYQYFNYIEEAEKLGKHAVVVKARRKGYSFKGASMLCRNFYLIPESKSYAIASENEYLTKDGLLTKAWDLMSWIDYNTAWTKKRQKVDTKMHKRASYVVNSDGTMIEAGIMSEVMGITLKNDIQKARGKAGKLILWEEGGKFPGLREAWQMARPSVEQGSNVFGLMIAYGCVCEGTKIITNEGVPISIEKLTKEDGIIGYNTYSTVKQNIEHFREPYETQCYRIITNSGRSLEASIDHPIIYSNKKLTKRVPGKRKENLHMKSWKWEQLQNFKVGDQVGVIEEIGIFGREEMWNPRLIGWLIGDGSYGIDKTPRLSNCEDEINEYIDSHFNTVVEKEYQTKDSKRYRETRIKDICYKLRELGIYGQVKENKRLPDLIFNCTKNDVCELIGGLFDTDGYISKLQNKTNHRIVLTSAYKILLDQVLFLLLKLGIHGKIRFIKPNLKNSKDRNGYYRLEISDVKSLIQFVNNIRFFPKEKQNRLELYKESLKFKKSELSKYIHGLRFERVVSIEDIGIQKVYNISSDESHTYIANGFITHNTGGSNEGDYAGLKDLFYEPDGYNVLSIDNIWDEGATKRCGFFIPEYANMGGSDTQGRLFMDSDGNTNMQVAVEYALKERQKIIDNATDRSAIDRYIAEHPFCLHGDTWVSDNGCTSRIKDNPNKIYNGKSDLYKLETVNGRTLICTNTHPIYNGKEYIPLSNYKLGDNIKLLNYEFNSDYQKIDIETDFSFLNQSLVIDEEWAEFIGFFMGDGSFSSKQGSLSIVFDIKDSNSSDYISNFIIRKFGRVNIRNVTSNMIELRVSDKNFTKLFRSLDLIKLSSSDGKGYWKRNIHIPDYIIKSPKSVVSAFLRGLFDSDGSITTKNGVINFGSKFDSFIKDILFLLSGYKIYPKYSSIKRINNRGYEYIDNKLNLRRCDNLIFSQYIRFRSDRKNDILDNNKSSRIISTDYTIDIVKSIEFFSNDDVYNLTTNKGYYCANGLWTHNSPMEATLQLSGNIFPKKDLIRHLATIRNTESLRNLKQVGELYFDKDGVLKWKQNKDIKDLRRYKLEKTDSRKGAIVIWEHPMDNPPWGLYIAAADPYDHDKSGTDSLGSVFIYKRFQTFEYSYDTIVAEYTGRPDTADEFYEIVRMLLLYYNATVLYENQNPGLSTYFKNKHYEYLLADQPEIISKIIKDSKVARVKGTHMVTALKDWAEGRFRDWLIEEYEPGKKNLTKIYSEPLLEEIIAYNDKGNFDRVSAMFVLMIYKEELHELHVKKKEEIEKVNLLFSSPIFAPVEFETFK